MTHIHHHLQLTSEELMTIMKAQGCFTEDSLAFLERMLSQVISIYAHLPDHACHYVTVILIHTLVISQSGCGPSTAWPPGMLNLCAL
jgi:hypothetical protein